MIHRALAVLTALALLAVPMAAGAQTEAERQSAGTATTSLTLASLDLAALPADLDLTDLAGLGALTSYASTDTDAAMNELGAGVPFALSSVALPLVGVMAARSDGDTSHGGQTVDLANLGSVTAGGLQASVVDGVASSTIGALTGSLSSLVGGVTVGVPQGGASSLVDLDQARSANGAVLSDLSIGLTDILPVEILEQLPLEVLLGLVGELPLDIDLDGLTGRVRDLVGKILALADLQGRIEAVDAELDELLTELAEVEAEIPALADALAAAQDAVTPATAAVTDATEALTEREAELATAEATLAAAEAALAEAIAELDECISLLGVSLCTDLESEVEDAQAAADAAAQAVSAAETAVTAAEQTLSDAQAALEDATDAVTEAESLLDAAKALKDMLVKAIGELEDTLQGLVDDLLDVVDDLLTLLPTIDVEDLLATVEALVDGLAGLELLAVDQLSVGVTTLATADGSTATALCDVSGVTLLGQARPVDTCAQLEGVLGELELELTDLLSALPLELLDGVTAQDRSFSSAHDVLSDMVRVSGLTTSTTEDDTRVGDYQRAAAAIDGLDLEVLPLELTQVTDGLVAEITGLVDGALDELAGLTGLDPALVADLGTVEDLLDTLLGVLGELPTGDLLGSASTLGLSLEALDVGSESTFAAAASSGGPVPAPVPAGPTPSTDSPQAPTPAPELPRTGGGMAGLALLLLGLGGGGTSWAIGGRRTG